MENFFQDIFGYQRFKIFPSDTQSSNVNHLKISVDQIAVMIDLIPIPICLIDNNGSIQKFNIAFRNTMYFDPLNMNKQSFNLMEMIATESLDSFYSSLISLREIDSKYVNGEFMTKSREAGEIHKTTYSWTMSWAPGRTCILAAGMKFLRNNTMRLHMDVPPKPTLPREPFSFLNKQKSVASKHEIDEEERGNFADVWTKFLDKVDEKTKRVLELKSAELKAQALAETLETKRIFVRHVSHEIRTPLNVVMSGLEYLNSFQEGISKEAADVIRDIKSACSVAIDILNDLLTYEKIDSNILALDRSHCDVVLLVKKVFNMFQIQAKYSDITMELDSPSPADSVMIDGDSTKLSQVLRNLVSNAVKFTPNEGKISIRMRIIEHSKRIRIEVQDTGPGILKEDRRRLFSEVVQFNPRELQNGQGSGLGLFLSRKIVDMHAGSIGVDIDWEGPGSIFFIELPILEQSCSILHKQGTHI